MLASSLSSSSQATLGHGRVAASRSRSPIQIRQDIVDRLRLPLDLSWTSSSTSAPTTLDVHTSEAHVSLPFDWNDHHVSTLSSAEFDAMMQGMHHSTWSSAFTGTASDKASLLDVELATSRRRLHEFPNTLPVVYPKCVATLDWNTACQHEILLSHGDDRDVPFTVAIWSLMQCLCHCFVFIH